MLLGLRLCRVVADRAHPLQSFKVLLLLAAFAAATTELLLCRTTQKELKRPMLIPPSDFGPKFKDTIR